MNEPIRVLLVEDAEEDALLLTRELRSSGFEPIIRVVDRSESMAKALREESWDLIIADYALPNFSGRHALEVWKASGLDIPFIVVSGRIGEDTAVETMKAGAHDYIMKNNLTRFAQAVKRELREARLRTEHRRLEEQLKLSERLRYVGAVAATIMHDFKQPMQIIMSCAEFLKSEGIEPEERARFLDDIVKYVKMLFTMSQEILYFSAGDCHLNLSPTNVDHLCQELVETYNQPLMSDRIALRYSKWTTELASPIMAVDRDRIWRAMVNLLTNAVDAMPHGGEIRIRLQLGEHETTIEIQDSGQGIPEAVRESLFEPFTTAGKRLGTGLGLAIVKSIVEAHGGAVSFTSQTGEGTTFRISLPRDNELQRRRHDSAGAVRETEAVAIDD